MTRARWLLALPALMIATSGATFASGVRDAAGMFSADAVRKADAELNRIEREYQVPVTIETVESLGGKNVTEVLTEHAKASNATGIYALIAERDHRTQVLAHKSYSRHLTDSRMHAVRQAIDDQFRKGDFDGGLLAGVTKLDATLAEARAEAGGSLKPAAPPARRAAEAPVAARRPAAARTSNWGVGSLLGIVLMIFAALLVFRIIGGLFSAARGGGGYGGGPGYGGPGRMGGPGYGGGGPGYGAPGYGGGGGGFMSSLFGGIGGAMAGNWLYDKMSGGHHQGGYADQTSYDPGTSAGIPDQAASGWDQPADAGDDWGPGNAADAGGGDWGGGGGGDWGGGGGGDWGGGGGGDWGGGDNGGSW